jgi:cellulose synthase/poly-beta-1,6-N-acetylglucosamine synthase-like glycosyltransferase
MTYFYWIIGIILALAWFSRIVDAALGMPSVGDVSRPQWDRNPVSASGNPRVSIIVPARNEQETIEQALRTLLALDYENYEVIAVNDRSTDRTGEIMERLAGERQRPPSSKDEGQVPTSGPTGQKWGTQLFRFFA